MTRASTSTTARVRTSAIAKNDKVDVMEADVWGDLTLHWTDRLRTTFGLRADYHRWQGR
jgi:hypothetical protein